MPPELDAWTGLLAGRAGPVTVPILDAIVERNDRTSSAAFKATSADGGRWWVKPLNNPCGARVPVTEYIIGNAGGLIDAPVCEVAVVEVPDELDGEIYGHERALQRGLAFASRDVHGVVESRRLEHRDLDDNRRRQSGVFALYDWCWGKDAQWLYAHEADQRTHSMDHGFYLPGNLLWTTADLRAHVDAPHEAPWSAIGLDPAAIDDYADRLEQVTRAEIRSMLEQVPPEWPVSQHELETVGWFLERRADPVARRLRRLAGRTSGGQQR